MMYAQPLKIMVFVTDYKAVMNPMHFQILSLILSCQNIVISALLIRLTNLSGKVLMRG